MTTTLHFTQGARAIRRALTIPAAAGTAATPSSLAGLTEGEISLCIGFKLDALKTDGTDRGAVLVGDSTGSLLQYVDAGVEYYEPARDDFANAYLRAASGGTIAAVGVFYMGG